MGDRRSEVPKSFIAHGMSSTTIETTSFMMEGSRVHSSEWKRGA